MLKNSDFGIKDVIILDENNLVLLLLENGLKVTVYNNHSINTVSEFANFSENPSIFNHLNEYERLILTSREDENGLIHEEAFNLDCENQDLGEITFSKDTTTDESLYSEAQENKDSEETLDGRIEYIGIPEHDFFKLVTKERVPSYLKRITVIDSRIKE